MKQGSNNKGRLRGRVPVKGNRGPSRNQTYDSNGPNVRVRGTAHQVMEKYLALARDASAQGDRVLAENYLQHAEHYYRIVNAINANQGGGRPYRAGDGPQPGQDAPVETRGGGGEPQPAAGNNGGEDGDDGGEATVTSTALAPAKQAARDEEPVKVAAAG